PLVHAVDGDRGVQVQRQRDDYHLQPELVLVCDELLVVGVERLIADPLGVVLAVDPGESLTEGGRLRVAVEDALLVERADVAGGDELDVLGVVLAQQHPALVPAADQGRPHGLVPLPLLVPEVDGRGDGQDRPGGDHGLHEPAAGQVASRLLEVVSALRLLLGGQVEGHVWGSWERFVYCRRWQVSGGAGNQRSLRPRRQRMVSVASPHPDQRNWSDLPLKGGGEKTSAAFLTTSPLEGEVAAEQRVAAGGGTNIINSRASSGCPWAFGHRGFGAL